MRKSMHSNFMVQGRRKIRDADRRKGDYTNEHESNGRTRIILMNQFFHFYKVIL